MAAPNRPQDPVTPLVFGLAAVFFMAAAANQVQAWRERNGKAAHSSNERARKNRRGKGKDVPGKSADTEREGRAASSADTGKSEKQGKPTSESTIRVTYPTTPNMTDATGHVVRAGAVLKLIDVVAGVCSRRHAGMHCVTISVDQVLLLKPIFLGDLLHLSASVNRAWGSSCEVGVRVVKETPDGRRTYVSHSYLTFVAVSNGPSSSSSGQPPPGVRLASRSSASAPPSESTFTRLFGRLLGSAPHPPPRPKVQLAPLLPRTPLEARRHLLAGRRRAQRIADARAGDARAGVSVEDKRAARAEIVRMKHAGGAEGAWAAAAQSAGMSADGEAEDGQTIKERATAQERELKALELEMVVRGYLSHDPAVSIDASRGLVTVNLPGDAPLVHPLDEVRAAAERMERAERLGKGNNQGADPTESADRNAEAQRRHSLSAGHFAPEVPGVSAKEGKGKAEQGALPAEKTLASCLHLVFPEHANSVGVLFGGQLMEWMEEVALIAARNVARTTDSDVQRFGSLRWGTVAMDGLEFPQAVAVGEVIEFSAIVTRTFSRSVEVFVVAEAESPEGTRRVTNDALLTLACADLHLFLANETMRTITDMGTPAPAGTTNPSQPLLREIVMPPGSTLERLAAVADERRRQRLETRDMLVRVYANADDVQ